MGGVQLENLSLLAKQIWGWREQWNIWVYAAYISSRKRKKTYRGGRNLVRKVYRMKGIPTETHNIVLPSLAQSSWKQYKTGFEKWWLFCTDKGFDPFRPEVPGRLLFLTDEFKKGGFMGPWIHTEIYKYNSKHIHTNFNQITYDVRYKIHKQFYGSCNFNSLCSRL